MAACMVALPKHHAHSNSQSPTNVSAQTATPVGFTPSQIKKAYGFPTTGGAGQTIALVDAYGDPTIATDLTKFSKNYTLPACTHANSCFTKVTQTGGTTYPGISSGWAMETSLDVEWAHAIAPQAKILLVEATSQSVTNLMAAVTYAANHASYVSMSWGFSSRNLVSKNAVFRAYTTVSFFASSGDSAGSVLYPSASPDVISVGGTSLTLTATTTITTETPWVTGGGGCTTSESASSAQASFPTYNQVGAACGAGKRATPDVALDADPTTGVSIYDSIPVTYTGTTYVTWYKIGGTSLSSPVWAARAADSGALVNATYVYETGNLPYNNISSGRTGTGSGRGHACLVGYSLCDGLGSWNSAIGTVYKELGLESATTPITTATKSALVVDLSGLAPAGGVAVTATSSSSGGGFSHTATGTFTSSLTVTISAGHHNSTTFYYRDSKVGTATLHFRSTGWTSWQRVISVETSVPVITSISPSSGLIGGGTAVTINGMALTSVTGVKFGTTSATYSAASPSKIVATSPAHSAGVVTVSVTTSHGSSAPQSADLFTYLTQLKTGYDVAGANGAVYVFDSPTQGSSGHYGTMPVTYPNSPLNKPVVGMVASASNNGYFLVASDGGVFAFGPGAPFKGSLPGLHVTPACPITGLVAVNNDQGYFLVGCDGGVFAFGTAPFVGSLPGEGIHVSNIIGIAATASGNGYWLISATGTVYAIGSAQNHGSVMGSSSAVAAIAGTPTGGGYWVATKNGGVYCFGSAANHGTLPSLNVNPNLAVVGIVHTQGTTGYWMLGADGGVFAFGTAPFYGSVPGLGIHTSNIVAAVPN